MKGELVDQHEAYTTLLNGLYVHVGIYLSYVV